MNDIQDRGDIHALLGTAVAEQPGLRNTPEDVLRLARRGAARRRATALGGLAAGAVVAVTVVATLPHASGPGVQAAARPSQTLSARPTPPPASVAPRPTTQAHAERLTALIAAAHAAPPGATLRPSQDGRHRGALEFSPLGPDSTAGYLASADVVDASGAGGISITVTSVTDLGSCAPPACAGPSRETRHYHLTVRGVDVTVNDEQRTAMGVHAITVAAELPDGTVVSASAVNRTTVMNAAGTPTSTVTRSTAPLTAEQLANLITTPGLTY